MALWKGFRTRADSVSCRANQDYPLTRVLFKEVHFAIINWVSIHPRERFHECMHSRSIIPFLIQLINQSILRFAVPSRPPSTNTAIDALVTPSAGKEARTAREQDEEDVLFSTTLAQSTNTRDQHNAPTLKNPKIPAHSA